jgi:hypothetical protein
MAEVISTYLLNEVISVKTLTIKSRLTSTPEADQREVIYPSLEKRGDFIIMMTYLLNSLIKFVGQMPTKKSVFFR